MKTKYKIFFAKIIFYILRIFLRKKKYIVTRKKINWNIDLSEAIDLHLFLFGSFEDEISSTALKLDFSKKKRILDIGANFGVQTLQFSKKFPNSIVYSLEPTNYAYKKMIENLNLNPHLKKKIYPEQLFICNKNQKLPKNIYSSWNLNSKMPSHHKHKGLKKNTNFSKLISLDDYLINNKIYDLDFIKLDVDGNELYVLQSGRKFLSKKKPPIFMELAPYLYKEHGYSPDDLINLVISLEYEFYNLKTLRKIKNIYKKINSIPDGSSENILLM